MNAGLSWIRIEIKSTEARRCPSIWSLQLALDPPFRLGGRVILAPVGVLLGIQLVGDDPKIRNDYELELGLWFSNYRAYGLDSCYSNLHSILLNIRTAPAHVTVHFAIFF